MPPKEDRKNPPCGQLFYFNCGNEVALAHQRSVSYTPPRIVRQMRRDLAYLPAWIAPKPEQDWVWLPCNALDFQKKCPSPLLTFLGQKRWSWRERFITLCASPFGARSLPFVLSFRNFARVSPCWISPTRTLALTPLSYTIGVCQWSYYKSCLSPLKLYPDFVILTRSWKRLVLRWLLGLFWQSSLFLLRGEGCCLTSCPCPKRAVVPSWLRDKKME